MSDLFSNKETKAYFEDLEQHFFDLRIPDSMTGYPYEKYLRIKELIKQENQRAASKDNDNIKFAKLKAYVEEEMKYGKTFKT